MNSSKTRARGVQRALGLAATVVLGAIAAGASFELDAHPLNPAPVAVTKSATLIPPIGPATFSLGFDVLDSLLGRSHKLRSAILPNGDSRLRIPVLARLFGDSALSRPGVFTVRDSTLPQTFAFITMLPFSAKQRGRIGTYRIGNFPYERRTARSAAYENPDGFIEVTPENADTYVSEHFRLRDFLTHDQQDVWPKYLVLNERLIDKLELVIEDLDAHGVPVQHMTVMSGFRTPEYNIQGVGEGGRARDSRHQYGDAADVFVDNDGDGRMDDLNHDGRIDARDAKVIRAAVDRVEAEHPELVGGVGVYRATRAHGPFAHIDARGTRARWGRA